MNSTCLVESLRITSSWVLWVWRLYFRWAQSLFFQSVLFRKPTSVSPASSISQFSFIGDYHRVPWEVHVNCEAQLEAVDHIRRYCCHQVSWHHRPAEPAFHIKSTRTNSLALLPPTLTVGPLHSPGSSYRSPKLRSASTSREHITVSREYSVVVEEPHKVVTPESPFCSFIYSFFLHVLAVTSFSQVSF